MNKIFLLLIIIFSSNAFSQEIKINHKFIIEFEQNLDSEMKFDIISIESYDKILESTKMDDLFSTKTKKNQIQGVFAKGKFGNNIGSMLILKSGLNETISYELKIKTSLKKQFKKTSTSAIFKDVKSIEYWPNKLTDIKFIDFKNIDFANNSTYEFDVKIDSTCFKNPEFDLEYGDKLLIEQIRFLYDNFSNDKDFTLEKVINYEKTTGTKDKSPGNFYAFMENEGYIEKKKLAKPLSYFMLECPFFERETLYFYNKRKKNVRLALFDWDKFEFRNFPPKTNYEQSEIEHSLKAKHEFIIKNVSEIFGPPINEIPIKVSGRLETKWIAENGIKAKTYLFIHNGIYNIRLYIFK